jgi:hypothetical protein
MTFISLTSSSVISYFLPVLEPPEARTIFKEAKEIHSLKLILVKSLYLYYS